MSNSPSSDICQLIEDGNEGTRGTNLFTGLMPDSPDACVAVYNRGGDAPETTNKIKNPQIRINVRGRLPDYESTWNWANRIFELLDGMTNATVGGSRYIQIRARGDIYDKNRDQNGRIIFELNFRVMRTN